MTCFSRSFAAAALAAAVFLTAGTAQACKFLPKTLAENIAAAPVVAIGNIETIENGLVILRVQQALKGVPAGQETVEFEMGQTSCHHRFEAGQRWLYMGTSYPEGSVLLEDEYARRMDENITAVEKELSAAGYNAGLALRTSSAVTGVLTNTCAPWDGAAVALTLEGTGVRAQIYISPADIGDTPRQYTLDGKMQQGSGRIYVCSAADATACREVQGDIWLHRSPAGDIEGKLQIREGEHTRLLLLRLKQEHKRQFCG